MDFKVVAKRVFISLQAGAALGMIGALLIAPSALEWAATPVVPTVCPCTEPVGWALAKFRSTMILTALAGSLVALIGVEVFRIIRAKRAAA